MGLFLPIKAQHSLIPSQVQSFLQQVQTDAVSEELTPAAMPEALIGPCERAEEGSLHTQKEDEEEANNERDEKKYEKTPPQLNKRCEKSEEHQKNIQCVFTEPEETQDDDSDPRGELQPIDVPDFLLPDAPEDAEGGIQSADTNEIIAVCAPITYKPTINTVRLLI